MGHRRPDSAASLHPQPAAEPVTRDLAVSVFVVWRGQVLLHDHPKLRLWLPPGGHVEANELPDDAAVREVLEESGVAVRLVGEPPLAAPGPRQLIRPRGVQLEVIEPGHEHIDLIYWARPLPGYDGRLARESAEAAPFGWYDERGAANLPLTPEMVAWVRLALSELA